MKVCDSKSFPQGLYIVTRAKHIHPRWRALWDWCIFVESFVPALLLGVAFAIQRRQHIATVGPSGAGKTTLVNWLVRFWEMDG